MKKITRGLEILLKTLTNYNKQTTLNIKSDTSFMDQRQTQQIVCDS